MCNFLRKFDPSFRAIPENGTAWKVFVVEEKALEGKFPTKKFLRQFNSLAPISYIIEKDGWVQWNDKNNKGLSEIKSDLVAFQLMGDGFCIMMSEEEANVIVDYYNKQGIYHQYPTLNVVIPVKYDKGLGTRKEYEMIKGMAFDIGIVGAFKPITEEYNI